MKGGRRTVFLRGLEQLMFFLEGFLLRESDGIRISRKLKRRGLMATKKQFLIP